MSALPVGLVPVSCDYETAGALSGFSKDTIERAVKAGEMEPHYPDLGPRQVAKPVVMYDELREWVERGRSERAR